MKQPQSATSSTFEPSIYPSASRTFAAPQPLFQLNEDPEDLLTDYGESPGWQPHSNAEVSIKDMGTSVTNQRSLSRSTMLRHSIGQIQDLKKSAVKSKWNSYLDEIDDLKDQDVTDEEF